MNDGLTFYVWQLANQTDINTYRGSGSATTLYCKVNVFASPTGIVTQLNTEDANAYVGLTAAVGTNRSLCARRLGMQQ
jgi:hypothetical protein